MLRYEDLVLFQGHCANAGIEEPAPLTRALELIDVARAERRRDVGSALDLTDADVSARIKDLALRGHAGAREALGAPLNGIEVGIEAFIEQVLVDVRAALLPHLDDIIVGLRPGFDAAAAPLVTAAQTFGFTWATTSDDVVRMRDHEATTAWADVPAAFKAVQSYESIRIAISELFSVSPTRAELGIGQSDHSSAADYSVCFAAGANWNTGGEFYVTADRGGRQRLVQLDWLKLARGGLQLNTPAEVTAKYAERRAVLNAG